MENLTYKKMQELLPEYVFGSLDDNDKLNFEQSLPMYPDLEKEVGEALAVFNKFDSMDIDGEIRKRTQNLSVKVNDKLDLKYQKNQRKSVLIRYAAPSLGLAFILLAVFFPTTTQEFLQNAFGFKNSEHSVALDTSLNRILNQNVFIALIDSGVTEADIIEVVDNSAYNLVSSNLTLPLDEEEINTHLENIITENLISSTQNSEINADDIYIPSYQLIDGIEDLNEDDLQYILKELTNEKINS